METGAIEATLVGPDGEKVVPIAFVKPGDVMLVRPGERIPTDGTVIEGFAAVDTSMMTGESLPREVGPGDALWGGTINTSGLLRVEATKVGSDTELARMAALVEKAQTGKSETQRLADRVSAVFVPIVIVISVITLFGWIFIGGSSAIAFQAAVATLIIACPCALGLATPTALLVGTGRGAQLGLLIRGPEVLETSRKIDTVVLDKTGTLTTGVMQVAEVMTSSGMSEAELLRVAASVEYGSEHPIARAIVRTALERSLTLSEATDFVAFAGFGVGATIDLAGVLAGTPAWLVERGLTLEEDLAFRIEEAREQGTVIAVASAGSVVGALVVTDTVRETSAQAVKNLRALGITPVMASGDHESVARRVADQVGIETVYSSLTPQGKAELVAQLQSDGHAVAMVGDGINDAPALATADLGIAMGSGTDAAMTAGDITIVSGDVLAISDGLRLAQRTLRTIQANLFWAFAYNVAAIPLAVAGLLNPIIAGLAMALSSVFVVTNSLRLRSFRPTR
jgi:Cu+-exporting ATPase